MRTTPPRTGPNHPKGPRILRDEGGAAALELALWASVMVAPMLSVVDIGFYLFQRTQVENATQVAAQAVWVACPPAKLPATVKCTGVNTTITTAIQSATSLTTQITATSTTEGYYCMVAGVLTPTGGALSAGPTTCANGAKSADYIQITGSYSYAPLFRGVSVASVLTTPITKTIWMRLS